jgi:hypothetical protein
MEPLLVLGAFIALAVLALRFGQDSRQGAVSAEEILGRQGVRWDLQVDDDPATSVNSLPARARGLATLWCVAVARALRSLGQRLSMESYATDAVWPTLRDYPYGESSR